MDKDYAVMLQEYNAELVTIGAHRHKSSGVDADIRVHAHSNDAGESKNGEDR